MIRMATNPIRRGVTLSFILLLFFISIPSTLLAQYSGYTYKPFSYTCASCPDADKDGVASACKAVPDPNSFSACLPSPGQTDGDGVVNADCNDNDPYSYVFGSGNIASVKLTQFDASGKVLSDPISPLLSANRLSINVTFRVGCGLTTPYPSYLTNLKVFYGTKNAAGQELLIELPPTVQQPTGTFWQTVVNGPTYGASYDKPLLNLIGAPTSYVSQVVEAAIESVSAKRPVFLKFVGTNIGSRADTPFYYNIPDMTNCARVGGNGMFPIVAMRSKDFLLASIPGKIVPSFNVTQLIDKMVGFKGLLDNIAPFSTNKGKFSYFIDLKNHDSHAWLDEFDKITDPSAVLQDNFFNSTLPTISSCTLPGATYMWYTDLRSIGLPGGIAGGNSFAIDLSSVNPYTPVHEFGHAFVNLNDEYAYGDRNYSKGIPTLDLPLTNCALNNPARKYTYGGKLYGGTNFSPCTWETHYFVNENGKSILNQFFRPSENSIMRHSIESNKFNIISCGYLLKKIRGNSSPVGSYWPECWTLDTI